MLYVESTLVYIGKSQINCFSRIKSHKTTYPELTSYKVYEIERGADIDVLEVYLINLYKPSYNLDSKATDKLSFEIPNLETILGKPKEDKF